MSLVVWLPLTKDLRQQGLSDTAITNHGATFNSNGKLGGCYSFDGVDDAITVGNLSTLVTDNFSFACWFYHDDTWSSKNYETIFGGPSGFELEAKSGSTNSPVIRAYSWGQGTFTYELNKWNHLVMTRTTSETKFYLNGELKLTGTAGTIPSGNYFVGSWSSTTGQNFKGKMNDVRIYDHCLSPMEIKQLSQGLVMHYPLNRGGFGQENLLSGNNAKITTWTNYMPNSVTLSGDGYDNKYTLIEGIGGWEKIFTEPISVTSGQDYTLSFDYSVEQNYRGYSGQFGLAVCTSSQAQYGNDTNVITKVNFGLTQKEKSRTSVTFTATSDTIYLVANGGCIEDGQTNISFYISYLKLEEGSIATPWCPNSSDALATTMGLNSTIEYDCSGFCNNGIRYGTFEFNSDTPKYSVSTQYNGTDNTLKIPFDASIWPDNFTMSIWFRKDELGSKSYETLFGGPSGFEMDTRSGSSSSLSIYMASTRGGTVYTGIEFGKWYMVTLVNDGTNELYYINGELVKTIAKKYMPVGNYWIGSWAGADKQNYKGLISDARVYATALSADDVKSLYQNCATIDPDGTIRGQIRS